MRLDKVFEKKKDEKLMRVWRITYRKLEMDKCLPSIRVTLGYYDDATVKKPHKLTSSAFRVITEA